MAYEETQSKHRRGGLGWVILGFVLGYAVGGPILSLFSDSSEETLPEAVSQPVVQSPVETVGVLTIEGATISYYTPEQGQGVDTRYERLVPGLSCAVDPSVIPYNSVVLIGNHWYLATDTGDFTHSKEGVVIGLCSRKLHGFVLGETLTVITPR